MYMVFIFRLQQDTGGYQTVVWTPVGYQAAVQVPDGYLVAVRGSGWLLGCCIYMKWVFNNGYYAYVFIYVYSNKT